MRLIYALALVSMATICGCGSDADAIHDAAYFKGFCKGSSDSMQAAYTSACSTYSSCTSAQASCVASLDLSIIRGVEDCGGTIDGSQVGKIACEN